MKIALSAICRGHVYALASALGRRGLLAALYCSYPKSMMRRENVDPRALRSYPWLHMPYMALRRLHLLPAELEAPWARIDGVAFGSFVARNLVNAEIFHGLSGHNLKAGLLAKERGAKYICDRGSSHIEYQDRILREEGERVGVPVKPIAPASIANERAEYAAADRIFVPSSFARRTFVAAGIPEAKLWSQPYGVNLAHWRPLAIGSDGKFRIIYFGGLSLRKGIHDLLAAFQLARIPNSELVLMGAIAPETDHLMAPYRSLGGVVVTGHVSQAKAREWFARSSVFVLPSIEDGFGLVLAEAQACGLPVIATENSGGPDVIREGENGYVVPIRNPPAIAERLVWLSENSDQLRAMGAAALSRVAEFRGWDNFADTMVSRYHALLNPSEDEFPPSDVAGT